MTRLAPAALLVLTASAVTAEDTRQLDAHEHGVGQLDIAFDGDRIAMELHAPGADIVGFEYAAETAEDRARVKAAVATLANPLDLFALPAAAGCHVEQAAASLESDHDDHDEDGHEDDHDDHEEHAEDGHKDEDHAHDDDHEEHDDHDEDGHKDEDHAHDEDHDDHAEDAGHTEFHAEYLLTCADPAQANLITFAYFETFPNALELEVQVVSDRGATAFEVARDAPTLDLRDIF